MRNTLMILSAVFVLATIACKNRQDEKKDHVDSTILAPDTATRQYPPPDSVQMPLDSVSTTGKSGNR